MVKGSDFTFAQVLEFFEGLLDKINMTCWRGITRDPDELDVYVFAVIRHVSVAVAKNSENYIDIKFMMKF